MLIRRLVDHLRRDRRQARQRGGCPGQFSLERLRKAFMRRDSHDRSDVTQAMGRHRGTSGSMKPGRVGIGALQAGIPATNNGVWRDFYSCYHRHGIYDPVGDPPRLAPRRLPVDPPGGILASKIKENQRGQTDSPRFYIRQLH